MHIHHKRGCSGIFVLIACLFIGCCRCNSGKTPAPSGSAPSGSAPSGSAPSGSAPSGSQEELIP